MSNLINAFSNAVAEYGPVNIAAIGKTASERKLAVLRVADASVQAFAVGVSGKVGKEARHNVAITGMAGIANAARRGNYKPLAEALAMLQGASVVIRNRTDYEALESRYEAMLLDAESSKGCGWRTDKKTGAQVPTGKRKLAHECLSLIATVKAGVEAILAQEGEQE